MSGGAYPPGCSQADLDRAQSCQGCGACEECRHDYEDMGGRHGVASSGDDEEKGATAMDWNDAVKAVESADGGKSGQVFLAVRDGDRYEFACVGEPHKRLNPWGRSNWTVNVYDLGDKAVKLYSMPASVFREVVKVVKTTAEHFGGIGGVAMYVSRTGAGKETTKYDCGFLRPLSDEEKAAVGAITPDQMHEIRDAEPFEERSQAGAPGGNGSPSQEVLRAAASAGAGYKDGDIPF